MRSLRGLIAVASLSVLAGCDAPAPPVAPEPTTEGRALELLELASSPEPDPARVETLFGVVDDEREHAALLDAIVRLRGATDVTVVETYTLEDLARTGFELEGALPGEGRARFSIQLDTSTQPGTIVWFTGPGVEWPERRRRGDGLSTSAPPGTPEG